MQNDAFQFGIHAIYIWPAYGLTVLVLVVNVIWALKFSRRQDKQLVRIYGNEKKTS